MKNQECVNCFNEIKFSIWLKYNGFCGECYDSLFKNNKEKIIGQCESCTKPIGWRELKTQSGYCDTCSDEIIYENQLLKLF